MEELILSNDEEQEPVEYSDHGLPVGTRNVGDTQMQQSNFTTINHQQMVA